MTDQHIYQLATDPIPNGKAVKATRILPIRFATVQDVCDARKQVTQDVSMAVFMLLLNGRPASVSVSLTEWTGGDEFKLQFIQAMATIVDLADE